jgi:hypothetical protein
VTGPGRTLWLADGSYVHSTTTSDGATWWAQRRVSDGGFVGHGAVRADGSEVYRVQS